MPVAASVVLAKSTCRVAEDSVRTNRSEVHQGWEGDGPVIRGINHITAIQLEERPRYTQVTELGTEHTKKPSASHWFNWNIMEGTVLIGL